MHAALDGIALVVFDLDGTLIDSAPDLALAVDRTLADYDFAPAGVARVRRWVGNGSRKLVERAFEDANALADGHFDLESAHEAFLRHYAAAPCVHTICYAGVQETLRALRDRGLDLMLVTNKPRVFLPPILDALELSDFFSLTLGGDSLAEKKPHPASLLYAAKKAAIAASASLMIGDSRNDIAAGRAAGFRTLAVSYGYNHGEPIRASAPDHVVDSLTELI